MRFITEEDLRQRFRRERLQNMSQKRERGLHREQDSF